jgi:hypothetical protein
MTDPALTNGPSQDGSNSLAKESKVGLAVSFVAAAALDAVIEGLTNLDTSGWSGWWSTLAIAAVATGLGLATAYRKRNR